MVRDFLKDNYKIYLPKTDKEYNINDGGDKEKMIKQYYYVYKMEFAHLDSYHTNTIPELRANLELMNRIRKRINETLNEIRNAKSIRWYLISRSMKIPDEFKEYVYDKSVNDDPVKNAKLLEWFDETLNEDKDNSKYKTINDKFNEIKTSYDEEKKKMDEIIDKNINDIKEIKEKHLNNLNSLNEKYKNLPPYPLNTAKPGFIESAKKFLKGTTEKTGYKNIGNDNNNNQIFYSVTSIPHYVYEDNSPVIFKLVEFDDKGTLYRLIDDNTNPIKINNNPIRKKILTIKGAIPSRIFSHQNIFTIIKPKPTKRLTIPKSIPKNDANLIGNCE
jgi:prefoldin subunit 5